MFDGQLTKITVDMFDYHNVQLILVYVATWVYTEIFITVIIS